MSHVQTTAGREPVDLTSFVFSSGAIGRLKVLKTEVVSAGDSYELDMLGSFRLSPLRRGLVLDNHLDIFTFYVPMRHIYGDAWINLMKNGIPKTGTPATLPVDTCAAHTDLNKGHVTDFLGIHVNQTSKKVPKFYYQSYLQIYNNYFKVPYEADQTTALASLSLLNMQDGFPCARLDSMWTKPLNENTATTSYVKPDATLGLDIMALNASYGKLQTQQERDHFMQRYRDVVSDMGGSTHYDADNRPALVMRTQQWATGYDIDGTAKDNLGQFTGRVQQPIHHSVPRYYVPEHGVMVTLVLSRFPVIHQNEIPWFVGKADLDYYDLACDPALIGNLPPRSTPSTYHFDGVEAGGSAYNALQAEGQQMRYSSSHVDKRFRDAQGYPFMSRIPTTVHDAAMNMDGDYDPIFQTNQIGDWNIQAKFNTTVYRRIPDVRQSLLTNQ